MSGSQGTPFAQALDLSALLALQQNTNQLLGAIQQAIADLTAAYAATWQAGLVTSLNTTLQRPSNVLGVTPLAQAQSTPADPAGTAAGPVMMGLAGAITPAVTGKVMVIVSGVVLNNGGAGDGANIQIRHGTGVTPANGDAVTGTAVGALQHHVASTAAERHGFSLNAFVSGLSLAAHWIDVSLEATTGGTASIFDVSITAIEVE